MRTQPQIARARALQTWLGDPEFHRSHQSNLMRKDVDYYRVFFGDAPADLDYVWPSA